MCRSWRRDASRLLLILEAEAGHPNDVAVLRARARQDLRYTEPLHLVVDVRQRLGRRDVVERDDPFQLPSDETELVLPQTLGASTFDLRPQDDDSRRDGLFVAGLVHERGHLADELTDPVTGDGGDA